ncbi:proteoglycan 3-like [Sorex araneus]|uniref:proteoglycan 3-like n=1 Tax=Sorex araneus TaxID=42254 RepID=UPI00243346B9|nr:proteoglycan 3-like [Sorex araneus]
MKLLLLLPLLLGAVSARHLGDNALPPESLDTQVDISQNSDCSREQKGELALHREEIPSGEEEAEASDCQETLEDKDDLDSDPAASGDFECPKEEDTVELQGTSGHNTCRHVLVRLPSTFAAASNTCRRCYRGNLVSIHDSNTNNRLRGLASGINQGQVWIGATIYQWHRCTRLRWTDGSLWNFSRWAAGQPRNGVGSCVTLCTRGGVWRRAPCTTLLSFICAA